MHAWCTHAGYAVHCEHPQYSHLIRGSSTNGTVMPTVLEELSVTIAHSTESREMDSRRCVETANMFFFSELQRQMYIIYIRAGIH